MYPRRHALQIRVSVNAAPELIEDFKRSDIEVGVVPMASAEMQDLATFAVLTAGSLTGASAVLRAFLWRHRHKSFLLAEDGSVEIKGMSQSEMVALVDRVLSEALERQAQSDALWDEVMPPREDFE